MLYGSVDHRREDSPSQSRQDVLAAGPNDLRIRDRWSPFREEKFIGANDAACSIITASEPVTLRFEGHSFFGRDSVQSTAAIRYDADRNAILITEGGTTRSRPETERLRAGRPNRVSGHDHRAGRFPIFPGTIGSPKVNMAR